MMSDNSLRLGNIQTNWQYRKYLTSHGDAIAMNNRLDAQTSFGYRIPSSRSKNGETPQEEFARSLYNYSIAPYPTPFLYKSVFDVHRPNGYEDSDLKRQFVWSREMDSRRVAPIFRGDVNALSLHKK